MGSEEKMKEGLGNEVSQLSLFFPVPAETVNCSWVGTSAGMAEEVAQVGIAAGTAEVGMAQGTLVVGMASGTLGVGMAQDTLVVGMAPGTLGVGMAQGTLWVGMALGTSVGIQEVAGRAACTAAAGKTSFWSLKT